MKSPLSKTTVLVLCCTAALTLADICAQAQNLYWDINGSTGGAGGTLPSGTWDAGASNWNASSLGTGSATTWGDGSNAVFSAGSDASGNYTVTLSGPQTAGALTFEDGVATLSGAGITLGGSNVMVSASRAIINSVISGSSGLVKAGVGELVLNAANNFSGNLTLQRGTLTLNHDQAASTGSLIFSTAGNSVLQTTVGITLTNAIDLGNANGNTLEMAADSGNTLTLNGVISNSHSWAANGTGTIVLGGAAANTFVGPVTVKQGTLVLAKDQALGSTLNGTIVNAGATLGIQGDLQYTLNESLTLNGSGVGAGGALNNLSGDNEFWGTVTLASDSSIGAAAGSSLGFIGPVSGGYTLTKTGAGQVDLFSAGNNVGTILVSQGIFGVWSPANAGTGLVTVSAGAVLAGNGSAPGGVDLYGTLSPGASPDEFDSGSQTWHNGASLVWEINDAAGSAGADPGWDWLNVSGSLNLGSLSSGGFTLNLVSLDAYYDVGDAANFDNSQQYDWTLLSTTTGISGFTTAQFVLNTNNFSNDLGGGRFVILTANSDKDLVLRFDPKPTITASDMTVNNDPDSAGAIVTLSSTVADNQGGWSVVYTTNGVAVASPGYFPVGTTIVTATVTDSVGNTNAATFNVTVLDAQPPALVFNSISVQLGAGGSYTLTPADLAQIAAGSSDNIAIASTNVSPDMLTVCDEGSQSVTLTLTDVHGNSTNYTGTLTVLAPVNPPAVVYVDVNYGTNCGPVTWPATDGAGTNYIGYNAFNTIQAAVNAVAVNGTVKVADGVYNGKVAINKGLTLWSANGSAATTIADPTATGLGTIQLVGPTTGVQVGEVGHGFTIQGIDSPSPGIEFAAVYLQGVHTNVTIIGNNIVAAGDEGLLTEYGKIVANLVITDNEFSGQSFTGPNPADSGFGNQFTTPNVPRQLVVIQPGSGPVVFSRNLVSGTAGGTNLADQPQGNTLVTIDGNNATIQDNNFTGVSTRYATALRIGGTDDVVGGNVFAGNTPGGLEVRSAAAATAHVNFNNFAGCSTNPGGAVVNDGVAPLDVASNWWGNASGPSSATANLYGTGAGVNGSVSVSPWLAAGTDTSGGIGFQPASEVNYLPTQLAFIIQPAGNALGSLLATQPVVQVRDQNNQPTPWANPTVTLALGNNPGQGVLAGTINEIASNGEAVYTDLTVNVGGGSGYTLVASAPSLTNAVSSSFDIGNPVPSLTILNPAGAVTGSGDASVTVTGNGFVPTSVVLMDNLPVATTFNSATQLLATLSTSVAGSHAVTVSNPPAGGGVSSGLTFTVGPAPAIVYVDDDYGPGNTGTYSWGYDAFNTISSGLTAVASGGTVNVAAGTYSEAVTIGKPVTLLGADADVSCGGSGQSVIDAGTGTAVTITSADVTVKGFKLLGAKGVSDTSFAGVWVQNNLINAGALGVQLQGINGAYTVQGNCINLAGQLAAGTPTVGIALGGMSGGAAVVQNNDIAGAYYGCLLFAVSNSPALTIKGGTITGAMQGVAVLNVDPQTLSAFAPSTLTVDGLSVSDFAGDYSAVPAMANINFHAGVYVYSGGTDSAAKITATITNVTVTGAGKPQPDSAGLYFADWSTAAGAMQEISVQDCTIDDNSNRGVYVRGTNATVGIVQSHIENNGFDPFGTGGNEGFGIMVRQGAKVSVSESFIANPATVTSSYQVYALSTDGAGSLVVSNCSVLNHGNAAGYLAGGSINAPGNWWGTTADTDIASRITGSVDFTPYLDSGTDIDSGTAGFQGDFSALHVTLAGAQTGSAGRIQEGMAMVSGSTLYIGAGNYLGSVALNKKVSLVGAGSGNNPAVDTIITPSAANASVLTITASGLSAVDRVVVQDLRLTGAVGSGNTACGVVFLTSGSHYTFQNVVSAGNGGHGMALNGGNVSDLVLNACSFSGNTGTGFRIPTGNSVDGMTVTASHFDGNAYGWEAYMGNGSGTVFQNLNVSDSTFNDDLYKGIYAEKLSDAVFSSITVSNSGTQGGFAAGVDINLKYGAYQNIQVTGSDIFNSGTGDAVNGAGITIKARGTGNDTSYSSTPASLVNVQLSGLNVSGCPDGMRFGEPGKNNAGPTDASVQYCNLAGNLVNGIRNASLAWTSAASNWWGSATGPAIALNAGGSGVAVTTNVDFSPWLSDGTDTQPGQVGFQPSLAPVYYTPASLVFSTQPGGANLGSPLSPQPVVTVRGEDGNVAAQYQGPVCLAIGSNPDGGVLAGTTSVNAVNGVATFGGLQINVGGGSAFQLSATVSASPNLTVLSDPFDIANPVPAITGLSPYWTRAGSGLASITLSGSGFVPDSVVKWNGSARPTHYVSPTELTMEVEPADIASANTAQIKVNNPAAGGGDSAEFAFRVEDATPGVVYVDDDYASLASDTSVDWPYAGAGSHIIGYDAFTTIQEGVNAVAGGGTVNVAPGTYGERVVISKTGVTVQGSGPASIVNGTTAVAATGVTPAVFKVAATGVTVGGFKVLVDFACNHSGVHSSGDCTGISIVSNTIIASASSTPAYGYGLRNAIAVNPNLSAAGYSYDNVGYAGVSVIGNTIENSGASYFRAGIQMDMCGGAIVGNTSTTINHDFITRFANQGDLLVSGNSFLGGGAQFGSFDPGVGNVIITNNLFDNSIMQPGTGTNIGTGASLRLSYYAEVSSVSNQVIVADNTFQNHRWGVSVEDFKNVTFDHNTFTPKAGSTDYIHMTFNTKIITSTSSNAAINMFLVGATLTRNTFNGSGAAGGTALAFYNHRSSDAVFGAYVLGTAGNENHFNAGIGQFILLDGSSGSTTTWAGFGEYAGIPATTMMPWPADLDAENNQFDVGSGLALPAAMSPADLFALEDRIQHQVDNRALGLVRVKAANVFVTQTSGSIQRGLDAAGTNDTVNVNDGSYTGSLVIGKPLNLVSANGAGTTTIVGTNQTAVTINADHVAVQGFTVSNPNAKWGIYAQNRSHLLIADNRVVDIGLTDSSLLESTGIGIGSYSASAVGDIRIVGNLVSNLVSSAKSGQAIVAGFSTGTADITGLVIASNRIAQISSGLKGAYGIQLNHTTSTSGGKTVAPQIVDNEISGLNGVWAHAIALEGNTPNALVSGNLISNITAANPDAVGVQVEENAFASTVMIVSNSFTGVLYGIQNVTGDPVMAANNWWGNSTGPSGSLNPYGAGVGVTGNVTLSPWLADGADTGSAIGFQPNPGVLNPPTHLVFLTQPVGAALGSPLATQPVVQALDVNDQLVSWVNTNVTVTLGSNPGAGVLTGMTTEQSSSGVATFTDLAVTVGGGSGFTLVASAPSLTNAVSSPFDIGNPVPSLAILNPAGAVTGSGDASVTVTGNGFVPTSVVLMDDSPVATTFNSATQLMATLSATAAGSHSVTVSNPPAGGGVSSGLTFTVGPAPAVVYVDDDYGPGNTGTYSWGYNAFNTITSGLAAVASGGTVNVAAGTYSEAVTIGKPVTLKGANFGVAGCDHTLPGSVIINNAGAALTIASPGVTVDGFELQGATGISDPGYADAAVLNNKINAGGLGIAMQGVNGAFVLQSNCVNVATNEVGVNPTVGIQLASISGAGTQLVSGNNITGSLYGYLLADVNSASPLVLNGGDISGVMQGVAAINYDLSYAQKASSFVVDGVNMSGFAGTSSNSDRNFHAGVYVYTGGSDPGATVTAVITNVTVAGTGKIAADCAGLSFADFSTAAGPRQNITVWNSDIENNLNRGVNVRGSNAVVTVTGSSILDNGADPFGAGGNHGFGIIARNNATVTLNQCYIRNPNAQTSDSVFALAADADTNPLGPTLTVNDCSITDNGNTNGKLAEQSAGTLDASGNWWGTVNDTDIASLMTGNVDFTPYLAAGTDVSATSGFQGDFSSLKATGLGAQTGGAGRVQEGVDLVQDGGLTGGSRLVEVQPGVYAEDLLIDKSLKLIGPNAGIPGAGVRLASEAILVPQTQDVDFGIVVQVAADNVTIDGLEINGDNPSLSGGRAIGSADANTSTGIQNGPFSDPDYVVGTYLITNLVVQDTVFKNFTWDGIYIGEQYGVDDGYITVRNNQFENLAEGAQFYAVQADFSENDGTNITRLVSLHQVATGGEPGFLSRITDNSLAVSTDASVWNARGPGYGLPGRDVGIWVNGRHDAAPPLSVSNNIITVPGGLPPGATFWGMAAWEVTGDRQLNFANNIVNGNGQAAVGLWAWGLKSSAPVKISGGALNQINGAGVLAVNRHSSWGDDNTAITVDGVTITTTASGVGAEAYDDPAAAAGYTAQITVQGNTSVNGASAGVLVSGADASALVQNNAASLTGNGLGVAVDAGKARIENNDLTGNTTAGIWATNGAIVDAGDCLADNITGLGSSAGGNNLTGYLNTGNAIINSGSLVRAYGNSFGATTASPSIGSAFTGVVSASQAGGLLVVPTVAGSTVECPDSLPAPANTLAGILALGGAASATDGVIVTNEDGPVTGANAPYEGTRTRTYTLTDACGQSAIVTQIFTVDDTNPPTITTGATNETIVADSSAQAPVPDLTPQVVASDDCSGGVTLTQIPAAGTMVGLGNTLVTVWAADHGGNSNSCTATITVIDQTVPVLTLPPNVTVTTLQDKDPYATGYATATDANGPVTITYDDNRNGLTNYNATGDILRTWTATDSASNVITGVQTVTVVDTNAPYFTYAPANLTVTNDPGECGAVVNYASTAMDPDHFQGFENPDWVSGNYQTLPSTDWNDYSSHIARVVSGTDGIIAKSGAAFGLIDATSIPPAPYNYTGIFSRLGGYYNSFGTGFRASLDVYLDLNDPAVASNTYAFDVDAAANTQSGGNLRDFIFHVASDASGHLLVAGDNNTTGTKRNDLAAISHYTVTNSGWFTLEWNFRNTNGVLAVDLNLRDAAGALLWTETRSNAADLIATVVGGNRYLWFNFLEVGKLAIDNTTLERNVAVTSNIASGSNFPVGTTAVTNTATDFYGNSNNCAFTVTVLDLEAPVISPLADLVTTNTPGACSASVTYPTLAATDNCDVASVEANPPTGTSFDVGTNPVEVVATDIHGNRSTNSFNVIVQDVEPPVIQPLVDIVTTNDWDVCGALVSYPTLAATDNCAVASIVADPPSGTSFAVGTTPVVVVATDIHGNTSTNSFAVIVNDVQPPTANVPADIVQGVDLGQNYATVNFSLPGQLDNCGIQGQVATPASGSQFPVGTNVVTVVVTDVHDNTATNRFTVAVIALPDITGQPQSRTNFAGSTATFTVAAGSPANLTYQWQKGGNPLSDGGNISGATNATLQIANVTDADAGDYLVVVGNLAGTVASDAATLTIFDAPSITVQPVGVTNNATTLATFTVTLATNSTPPLAFQWLKNGTNLADGGNIHGANAITLTVSNLLAADAGDYSVIVTNLVGSILSSNATLGVIDPVIFAQPLSVTNPLGGNVAFSVTAAGTAQLHYQWQQNSVDLPGQTASNLVLNGITDSSAGNYRVVVTNAAGLTISSNAVLTITHPPVFTQQPASLVVNQGQNAQFAVNVNGTAPFTYQWRKDGNPLSDSGHILGSSSRTLVINAATAADEGAYSVYVLNADGNNTSSNATLAVIVPPTITFQPLSLTNNADTTATFVVSNTGSASVYRWYKNGTTLLSDGGNIYGAATPVLTISNVFGADAGTYSVIISNAAAAVTSSNAMLTVMDPILTSQPASLTQNAGETAIFTVTAVGTSPAYQWYKDTTPLSDGVNISGANTATLTLGNVQDADAAGYSVVVSTAYGMATSAPPATLTVITPPVITTPPASLTVSATSNATFTVSYTGTAPGFQWLVNGVPLAGANGVTLTLNNVSQADALDYAVVLSNAAGTVTSTPPAHLTVIDPPVITSQPVSLTNYAGTVAFFSVTNSGSAAVYQWVKNGTNLTDVDNIYGSATSVLTVSNVLGADGADYAVIISNAAGVATSEVATLTAVDPFISAQPVGVTNITGSSVNFSVTAVGTEPLSYQWYQNDGLNVYQLYGETGSSLTLNNVSSGDQGDYFVVITNVYGAATSAPAMLVTIPPLIVNQPVSLTRNQGQSASFSVDVNGATPFSYQWFKDGTNLLNALPNETNRILSFASVLAGDAGGYRVHVTNPSGDQWSDAATLTVIVPPVITSQPTNVVALVGENVSFQVTVSGTLPLACQWYHDSNSVPSAGTATLNLSGVTTNDAGTYFVTVTNPAGAVTSNVATLSVYATAVPVMTMVYSNGVAVVALAGVPTFTYVIEGSTNLLDWTSLETNASPFSLVDTNTVQVPNRFYRGIYSP